MKKFLVIAALILCVISAHAKKKETKSDTGFFPLCFLTSIQGTNSHGDWILLQYDSDSKYKKITCNDLMTLAGNSIETNIPQGKIQEIHGNKWLGTLSGNIWYLYAPKAEVARHTRARQR